MKIALAVVLMLLNAFLQVATYSGEPGLANLAIAVLGIALLGPGVLGLLFCIPPARRTRGHYLNGFLIVSALLAVTGVLNLVQGATVAPKQVATPDGRVSLTVPADWKTPPADNPNVDLVVTDRLGVVAVIVTAIPKDAEAPASLEELAAGAPAMFPAGAVRSSTGPHACSVPAMRCTYHELDVDAGQNGAIAMVAFVEGRSVFYNVTATAGRAIYPDEKAGLLEILASLKEAGGPAAP